MAYEFTKLADVPALEEVPEGANAFIEVAGEIKRVPGAGLVGGIPTAIIHLTIETDSNGDWTNISGTCDNMTYAEAKAILTAGEPMMAIMVFEGEYTNDGVTTHYKSVETAYGLSLTVGIDAVFIGWENLWWLPDGTITSAE